MDVYDLDGTILRGNSFTRFVVYLFRRSIARLDLVTAGRLAAGVLLRKARLISHLELKRRAVVLAVGLPDAEMSRFIASIAADCRPRLASLRARFGRASCTVLATAAPSDYASGVASLLGFEHVIASGFEGGRYVETIRERKRDRVVALSVALGNPLGIVFTDHPDDLSLALVASRVVAVDASDRFIHALDAAGKSVERVDFS